MHIDMIEYACATPISRVTLFHTPVVMLPEARSECASVFRWLLDTLQILKFQASSYASLEGAYPYRYWDDCHTPVVQILPDI